MPPAEASSKISLISPDQFQFPLPARPNLVKEESSVSHSPSPPPSQTNSSPSHAIHKQELVKTVSGNSSTSIEVANILEEVGKYQDLEQMEEEEESPAYRTF
jgi:hypothetical protein